MESDRPGKVFSSFRVVDHGVLEHGVIVACYQFKLGDSGSRRHARQLAQLQAYQKNFLIQ